MDHRRQSRICFKGGVLKNKMTCHPEKHVSPLMRKMSSSQTTEDSVWREMYIQLSKEFGEQQVLFGRKIESIVRAYESKLKSERDEQSKATEAGYEEAWKIIQDLKKQLEQKENDDLEN